MTKSELIAKFFAEDEEAAGLSNGEIARRLNVSRALVSRVRLKLGLATTSRQARIGGELRWMHTGAIGKQGPEAELERVKKEVGAAWVRYQEKCKELRTEPVDRAFAGLWALLIAL